MLDVLNRILQFGQETNFPYWKKALACFCQDDTMRTFSLYSVAIECIDSYDFLQDDITSYKSDGGGARRVRCKRSAACYYAAVLRLQFKLQNI